jgi:hypothetical protein
VAAQTDGFSRINLMGSRRNPQNDWIRTQATDSSNDLSTPHELGGLLASSAVAANSNGRLELFGVNSQGQAWRQGQVDVLGVKLYTGWAGFGLDGKVLRAIAAERNANNVVEVFALDSTGQVWHRWETGPSTGFYTAWVTLDSTLSTVAVARNKSGLLTLYGVNNAGQLVYRNATAGVNTWAAAHTLDLPPTFGRLRSVAAETNLDGRIELFAVDTLGQLWHRAQTSADTEAYGGWATLPSIPLRP